MRGRAGGHQARPAGAVGGRSDAGDPDAGWQVSWVARAEPRDGHPHTHGQADVDRAGWRGAVQAGDDVGAPA